MKYFVAPAQCEGTCYYEFFKGKWDGKTFWKNDSICLHDNILFAISGFEEAIIAVIPTYDPFGETEVYPEQWSKIGELTKQKQDTKAHELYLEADSWVQYVFSSYDCFTILGI